MRYFLTALTVLAFASYVNNLYRLSLSGQWTGWDTVCLATAAPWLLVLTIGTLVRARR